MESFSQIEIYNSYLFLRTLLGITNNKKNDTLKIGIRYTGNEILAVNEHSTKTVLLIRKNAVGSWFFSSAYPELEPIATHIKSAIKDSSNKFLSEPAFEALQNIFKLHYRD